jgi:hypothetical protein
MDRIGCCGNAVVPQVAQFIARRLKEIIEEKENYGAIRNRITAKVTKAL